MIKADNLLPILKDKLLEISMGDDYEEIILSDHSRTVNGAVYGYLKDIVDDFMVLDCLYVDKDEDVKFGNIIYLNVRYVKAISQVKHNGSLNDVMVSVNHIKKIKKLIGMNG